VARNNFSHVKVSRNTKKFGQACLIVTRLLKEMLQQPTISNYLTQVRNKPTRIPNISLAPGSQKEINQLLLHCCAFAFTFTKESLLNLLTTFLKKH